MKSCPCESLWIRAYGCETSFWYYLGLNFSSINSRATNANVKITPWRGNVFSDAWVQNLLSESRGTRTTQVIFIQHVCNNSLRKQLIASLAQTLLLEWPTMLIWSASAQRIPSSKSRSRHAPVNEHCLVSNREGLGTSPFLWDKKDP